MEAQAYLDELSGYLAGRMQRRELDSVLEYYKEYFEEKGPDGAWQAEEELGTPDEAAARILGATSRPGGRERRRWSTGQIVAAIVLSPIWVPVLLGLAAVVITLALGLLGTAACIAAGGIACVLGGLFVVWCGITQIFYSVPTTLFFTGLGFVAAALGLLIFLGGAALCVLWCKGVAALVRWIARGGRREEAAA